MPNYDPFEEGDALTAANINSRLTTMSTWVNDLPASSVARWALRHDHLPSQTFADLFPNGFSAESPAHTSGSTSGVHDNSLPYSAGPAHPVNYQAFSTSGGSAPYGPVSADNGGGWRVPAQTGGTSPMEVDAGTPFTPSDYDLQLLVRAQVEIFDSLGGQDATGGGPQDEYLSRCALIGIGFEDGLGARYVIERTVRWNNLRGCTRGTISTSTYIKAADLSAGDGQVSKVFGVVASQRWADTGLSSPPTAYDLDIRHYNISIIPIRSGALV